MPSAATYKCPRCGAPLAFSSETQSWSCAFCLGDFSLEELEAMDIPGEKEADTAATFCAFCQNPAILTERLSGEFRRQSSSPSG